MYDILTDKLYVYTKQDEVSDGYYEVPNVIGVWDNKYELMRYINQYRKEKWYELVRERTSFREELTNPNYDYGIYREYDPELYVTEIVKNEGHWMGYDDLVSHSSQDEQWATYPQKLFLEMNDEELWIPSIEEQENVKTDIEVKKKKNMDKDKITRFANLYREFKQRGLVDKIVESIEKHNEQ